VVPPPIANTRPARTARKRDDYRHTCAIAQKRRPGSRTAAQVDDRLAGERAESEVEQQAEQRLKVGASMNAQSHRWSRGRSAVSARWRNALTVAVTPRRSAAQRSQE
jgi:hypothetical protein